MTTGIAQAIRALLDLPQSPQRALVDATCELHRLDYRLLEVMQSLKLPRDYAAMQGIRTPNTVEVSLYISVDAVRDKLGGTAKNPLEQTDVTCLLLCTRWGWAGRTHRAPDGCYCGQ